MQKPFVIRLLGYEYENVRVLAEEWTKKHEIYFEEDFDKACQIAVEVAAREEEKLAMLKVESEAGSSKAQ